MKIFLALLFLSSCSTAPCLHVVSKTVDFVDECEGKVCSVTYTDGTEGQQFMAHEDDVYEVCE